MREIRFGGLVQTDSPMLRRLAIVLCSLLSYAEARQSPADSARLLRPVTIKGYFREQPTLTLPASVSVVGEEQLGALQPFSLLPAINASPGVRMEERSPGSNRLSIRGSLLRSPYGVRNIKIYLEDFILTDAGGNTYMGSLDPSGLGEVRILKGPQGSVFGANTGGVMLLRAKSVPPDSSAAAFGLTGGAYGLLHQDFTAYIAKDTKSLQIKQAWQRSDGYRENSSLDRKYLHLLPEWSYSKRANLKALLLYSHAEYRTPGGLTWEQVLKDPRSARPATRMLPGAVEQNAGIDNKTVLGGLQHEYRLSQSIRHVISLTASHTDLENPFITNYEVRDETSLGLRSYVELLSRRSPIFQWEGQLGLETQGTSMDVANYGNRGGKRDTLQAASDLDARQHFFFLNMSSSFLGRFVAEAALSVNVYNYRYSDRGKSELRNFEDQLMPRFSLSYLFAKEAALRMSVSRGYSPPTLAEIRPSDNVINTSLEAETGWNYEAGVRAALFNNRLYYDLVFFNFDLSDAIVRRLHEDGNEFFVNAGGTKQRGVESQLDAWLVSPGETGFLRSLKLSSSYTLSSFYFRNYAGQGGNYSGNRLTGVPRHFVTASFQARINRGFLLNAQYQYTSSTPLNDASTAYAKSFQLLQVKAGWTGKIRTVGTISVFAGADNLLNERYSLGNDLNAVGERYFNPAPGRNFFAGFSWSI